MSQTQQVSASRRRWPRIAPAADAPVVVDINGENFIDVLKARDISEGGVGLYVRHGFQQCQIDGLVSLVVSLPKPVCGSFSVSARIRHKASGFFGVQFVDLRPEDRRLIRRYISARGAPPRFRWLSFLFKPA